jgi:hypothetical protein
MQKAIALWILLLLVFTSAYSKEGLVFYSEDNPNTKCVLTVQQGGNYITWECIAGHPYTYKYYQTTKIDGNLELYSYENGNFIIAILQGFGAVSVTPIHENLPTAMFYRVQAVAPQPYHPQQNWGGLCDPLDIDLLTGKCASGGSYGGGGGGDISSCLKAADDAERTANMMDEGVSKTMLMQNVIAARARCYNY